MLDAANLHKCPNLERLEFQSNNLSGITDSFDTSLVLQKLRHANLRDNPLLLRNIWLTGWFWSRFVPGPMTGPHPIEVINIGNTGGHAFPAHSDVPITGTQWGHLKEFIADNNYFRSAKPFISVTLINRDLL